MSVQLAVAPIAWSNSDLPQLGGDTPWKPASGRVVKLASLGPKVVQNIRWIPKSLDPSSKNTI